MTRLPNVKVCSAHAPSTRQRHPLPSPSPTVQRDASYTNDKCNSDDVSDARAQQRLPSPLDNERNPNLRCPPAAIATTDDGAALACSRAGVYTSLESLTHPSPRNVCVARSGYSIDSTAESDQHRQLPNSSHTTDKEGSARRRDTSRQSTQPYRHTLEQRCRMSHRRFLELCGKVKPRSTAPSFATDGDGRSLWSSERAPPQLPSGGNHNNSSSGSSTAIRDLSSEYPSLCNPSVAASNNHSSSRNSDNSRPTGARDSFYLSGVVNDWPDRASVSGYTQGTGEAVGQDAPSRRRAGRPRLSMWNLTMAPVRTTTAATTTATTAKDSPAAASEATLDLVYGTGTYGLREQALRREMKARGGANAHESHSTEVQPQAAGSGGSGGSGTTRGRRTVFDRLGQRKQHPPLLAARPARPADTAALPRVPAFSPQGTPTAASATTITPGEDDAAGAVQLPAVPKRNHEMLKVDSATIPNATTSATLGSSPAVGGVMDVFGYFPTHRVHPAYYWQLLADHDRQQDAAAEEKARRYAAHTAKVMSRMGGLGVGGAGSTLRGR